MKEEKDIQPIDKLFRQSLEGYTPVPPPSVWKSIKAKKGIRSSGSGKWYLSHGGLPVISVALLVLSSFLIYKFIFTETEMARQNTSVSLYLADSAKSQQPGSVKDTATTEIQTKAASNPVSVENNKPGLQSNDGSKTSGHSKSISENLPDNRMVSSALTYSNLKTQTSPDLALEYQNSESPGPLRDDVPSITSKKNAEIQLADKAFIFRDTDIIVALIERSAGVIVTYVPNTKEEVGFSPIAEGKSNPDTNTINNPVTPKPSKPETKNWVGQVGIYVNFGQVYQQDRSPNFFYGGMITGGLWNKKWNAGIETGIGICKYKDYGQVENSWIVNDSVMKKDTIWHQQDSLNYFEIVDSIVYLPVSFSETLDYQYSYSFLQLPLFISKQIANFGKLSLGVKAGPLVGFLISKKESVSGTKPPENVIVSQVNKNYSRLEISWQLHIAPQLRWDVNNKFSLTCSPSAVFFLNNLYEKDNKPLSKPYGLSIYGGITYKF
jgi:hypothetical protein